MLKRPNSLHIKLSDDELEHVRAKAKIARKPTMQAYALDALLNSEITDQDVIDELHNINMQLADIDRQARGVARNINQIAKKCNTYDIVLRDDIQVIREQLENDKERRLKIWQSISSWTALALHTPT